MDFVPLQVWATATCRSIVDTTAYMKTGCCFELERRNISRDRFSIIFEHLVLDRGCCPLVQRQLLGAGYPV